MTDRCAGCGAPTAWCVCDRLAPRTTRARVLVLQHPQEAREPLGSAPLLARALPEAVVRTGLSWPSLAAALDDTRADPARWGVLWRGQPPRALTVEEERTPFLALDRHGSRLRPSDLDGLVVLDGTWSQGKTLWWRNPWLLKLSRVLLWPAAPSAYGRLRKEPRREAVSTLEAVALGLSGLGEEPEVEASLLRLFRTFTQRARDVPRPEPGA